MTSRILHSVLRILLLVGGWIFVLMILLSAQGYAQVYQLAPVAHQQLFTNNGAIAAGYKLCTFAAGSTTPLAAYSDNAGTTLPNPITLNAAGRPQTAGGTETGLYLSAALYKFILYASGTGNTCNGTQVGAQIWSQDNISTNAGLVTGANLDCSAYFSAANNTYSTALTACANALPSGGGTADARRLGALSSTWGTDAFNGISKPIDFICGASTITVSVTSTIVASVHAIMGDGCILSVNAGVTLTINGPMDGSSLSQHFSGSGIVKIALPLVYPQWFGATATQGIQEAVTAAAANSFGSVYIPAGTYNISAGITVPAANNLEIWGAGPSATVIQNTTLSSVSLTMASTFGIMSIHDLLFRPQATRGTFEIKANGPGGFLYIHNVHVLGGYGGLWIQDVNTSTLNSINMNSLSNYGLFLEASNNAVAGTISNTSINIGNTTGTAILIQADGTGVITGINTSTLTLQGGAINLDLEQSGMSSSFGESLFTGTTIDSANNISVKGFSARDGFAFGIKFDGLYGAPTGTNAAVFDFEDFYGIQLNNAIIGSHNGASANAVVLRGVHGARIANSQISSTGIVVNLILSGAAAQPCTDVQIENNQLGKTIGGSVEATTGINLSAAAHANIVMLGNEIYSTSTDIANASTGTGKNLTLGRNTTQNSLVINANTQATVSAAVSGAVSITPSGSTNPVTFLNNGGNAAVIVNGTGTDFSSGIFVSEGTMAVVGGATPSHDAKVLAINASGGDGKSQLVTTHTGGGVTQPLEIWSDSTLLATFAPGALAFNNITTSNTGDFLCINNATQAVTQGTTCTLSSERYKHDFEPLDAGLDTVLRIPTYSYVRNDHPEMGRQVGLKAEAVAEIEPRVVLLDREGKPSTVLYENYTAILTKAIQELTERVKQLEAK